MGFILGVGRMNISSTRIDGTQNDPQILKGSRDATTIFGSIEVLSEPIQKGAATITPYTKLEAAYIDLDIYSEAGIWHWLMIVRKLSRR
ncbi:MAG: autotransporter outer membrane beta-barrel domain-containing protein [Oceanospirillales bacterium]|nr:autotransporter outer membrane beta-barrel domain-containing protein [Oceanospirillales bacterium]MBR9888291.1 autotransporter outer membrane beta-barrel domain-containing protein [Oceanospirillales bacterium]